MLFSYFFFIMSNEITSKFRLCFFRIGKIKSFEFNF